MKTFALLLCCGLMATVGAALWLLPSAFGPYPLPAVDPYVTGHATSESEWARALLEFVRQADSESEPQRADEAAAAALHAADRGAPIWVSLAQHRTGAWPALASLEQLQLELDLRAGRLSSKRADSVRQTQPLSGLTSALLDTLQPALERWRDGDDSLSELAAACTDSRDCAVLCLEAAVAADPQCVSAWSELALRASPQRRYAALQRWQALEPDNAAPAYLTAAWHARENELQPALAALRSGHAQRRLDVPRSDTPVHFDLRYPDDPVLGAEAGQPVSAVALGNLLSLRRARRVTPSLASELRWLAEALTQPSASATAHDELSLQLRQLGGRLVTVDQSTADEVRHGVAILLLGAALPPAVEQPVALSQYDFHLQRSTRELSAGLARWNDRRSQLLEDRSGWLQGRIDLPAEERAAMLQLVTQPRLQATLSVPAMR